MKKIICFYLLCYVTPSVYSQNLSKEFGQVTEADFSYEYEDDPDTEAVILFDKGYSHFIEDRTNGGFNIEFTRVKRIKINGQAGIELAEIEMPFYSDGYGKTEHITSIEAFTYNIANGIIQKKELDKNTVYEEKVSDRWNMKKFVFPDVQKGSIVEYRYTLETPFFFNLPDWEFQDIVPTVVSEYVVKLIPFYEYVYLSQGINHFSFKSSEVDKKYTRRFNGIDYYEMVHTFRMNEMPAFQDEAYITSANDYIAKIDFQLAKINRSDGVKIDIITTWEKLCSTLLKHENFGKYMSRSEKVASPVLNKELDLSGKNEVDKAREIIDYVKSAFSWNGYYQRYATESPKKVFEQKTGSSAEINLFLAGMLRAAGINADPVLISTRGHGIISANYPFENFFNYVIVMVNTGTFSFLTDGTDSRVSFDRIPLRCINEQGLIVGDGETKWVGLHSKIHSTNSKIVNLSPDPEALKSRANISIQTSEFESYIAKTSYNNDTLKLKAELINNNGLTHVSKLTTFGYDNNLRPYIILIEGEAALENIDNKIIVSPFLGFPLKENKLKQKERTYPVDFVYTKTEDYKINIEIPDGFEALELPRNYNTDNDLVSIHVDYQIMEKLVVVAANYTLKKAIYRPEEYAKIKQYLDIIVRKFNEQVIFQKKV